jgi:peptide/nickel transport system permease protein
MLDASLTTISDVRQLMRIFLRHRFARLGLIGLFIIATTALLGLLSLQVAGDSADLTAIYAAPSWSHPFGTDHLGRDLLARIFAGAHVSMGVALGATLVAFVFGCIYGLIAGMGPTMVDRGLMLLLDAMLSIPVLLLVIVSQAIGEASLLKMVLVIGLSSWMGTARLMRTECKRLMQAEFVRAAICAGASHSALALRHVIPNAAAPLLVVMTVGIGQAILIESTLSFLNLGVPVTLPSWGNLLANGMSSILSGAWWVVLFPGMMIVITVLCINLVGDGLRDTVDPTRRASL